jgi:hypothetical protein
MKSSALVAALFASAMFAPSAAFPQAAPRAAAASAQTLQFDMVVSPGASRCLPQAHGQVIDHTFGNVETLEVLVDHLPPNTDFDFFIIQVPNAPFGAAWYMGDINTDGTGTGVGNFVGRFSSETFIISLGTTPAPNEFPDPPAVVPEATNGVKTDPVQMYHLGLWFDSSDSAVHAGCPNTHTPFNGEHNAGIQVLNTGNFPNLTGPLIGIQ